MKIAKLIILAIPLVGLVYLAHHADTQRCEARGGTHSFMGFCRDRAGNPF